MNLHMDITSQYQNQTDYILFLRKGGKNTQKNYRKKILMTQIIILVWSLVQNQTSWSVTLSGPQEASLQRKLVDVMEFQLSYFKFSKNNTVKVLDSVCQQIWKMQQWPQDQKRSVFIPIPKKGRAKECSNYHTIALISHVSKVMLKILQARLQQYVNQQLLDVQAGFRKGIEIQRQKCQHLLDD